MALIPRNLASVEDRGMTDPHLRPAQARASNEVLYAGAPRVRPVRKFRTIYETAELLGVSSRTVTRLIQSGDLRAHRVGRAVRISDADLDAFLALNRSF